jgi:hypothetical protein
MSISPSHQKINNMKDKTTFQLTFDQPIHKGVIISYDPETKKGRIKSLNCEELPFQTENSESFKKDDRVLFNKYPWVRFIDKYYAANVKKACRSKDGFLVMDDTYSHVHKELKDKLSKIIKRINCSNREYIEDIITIYGLEGLCTCIPITCMDEIVYAKRIGREKYSKFVKNREPIPTNSISVFLKKKQDVYIIKSCYFGEFNTEPEFFLYDSSEGKRKSFWEDHALIFGSEPIYTETITTICPWSGIDERNTLASVFRNTVKVA